MTLSNSDKRYINAICFPLATVVTKEQEHSHDKKFMLGIQYTCTPTNGHNMQEKITGWQKIAQDKQARRNEQIPRGWRIPAAQLENLGDNITSFPKESGLLSDTELEITVRLVLSSRSVPG